MKVGGQLHDPTAVLSGERDPVPIGIGGWVDKGPQFRSFGR